MNTAIRLAVGAGVIAASAVAVPTASNNFCADVTETLKLNGTAIRSESFNLCMDAASLNWKREVAMPGDLHQAQIFTAKDNQLYDVYYEVSEEKHIKYLNCSVTTPKSPTTATDLPFRFVIIDDTATLNGTQKTGGVASEDYRHLRPAKSQGPFKFPAEDMNWYVSKAVVDNVVDMLETHCIETVQGEGETDGGRNFQKNYKRGVPPGTFDAPTGVHCTKIPPHANAYQHAGVEQWIRDIKAQ